MERLEIDFDKQRLGLLFGGCCFIFWGIFGFLLLYQPMNLNIPTVLLLLLMIITGLAMFFCFNRWMKDAPAMIIDAEGIWDNSTALSIGKIEWGQIETIEYNRQFRTIMIVLKDPMYFLNKKHNPLAKLILWFNWKFDTSPIHLNDNLIKISAEELMKEIQKRQRKNLPFDDFSEHLID